MNKEWIATYRLQLNRDFPLAAAAGVLPYLKKLGISHVYLSPCLQAVPGSTHGYDVTNPQRISGDIGGEEGWGLFSEAARTQGLGVLMDIVPNHMAVSTDNAWWEDVLANGPYSRFAGFFDIFDNPRQGAWTLHIAPLGTNPEELLRDGEFEVVWDGDAPPRLVCGGLSWPLGIQSGELLLTDAADGEREIFQELMDLRRNPAPGAEDRERWSKLRAAGWEVLRRNAGKIRTSFSPDEVSAVLAGQFYRLHHWEAAGEYQNFRRFFDVNTLVGMKMENADVFEACHARILKCIRNGEIDGLRVDHPDGLLDPRDYLQKLRDIFPCGRIYVEKILSGEEKLSSGWPVDGTVGYEFLSRLNRLWMDENKAGELSALYSAFTGESGDYPSLVPQKKRQVIRLLFRRELEYLVELALRVADREYGLPAPGRDCLREAIVALSVELPVYRTYKRGAELSDGDAEILRMALGRARTHHPDSGQEAFDLLERMLLEGNAEMGSEWVARWQQFTGPVTAKGLEDTAFYDFSRLISANEVGGEPGMAGISAESFHEFCDGMQRNRPGSLLLTATHDTKRGEDVRTRISVLSEQPAEWAEAVAAWSVMNAAGWGNHQPDRHMEYFLYQTLAGAWPLEEKRCQEYMLKACRESKRHTTWLYPDEGYERGLREFISHLYQSPEFISSLEKFLQPLVLAGHGNSLAQTLIKLTAPGVPDIYQGCELPEFSLVDPDNRRPVDFEARRRLLDGFEARAAPPSWQAPESKLWLTARALAVRRRHPADFGPAAAHTPLAARGPRLRHILAFQRGENVIVAVPRFRFSIGDDWGETSVPLPEGDWIDQFTGSCFRNAARAAALFSAFPAALLLRGSIP